MGLRGVQGAGRSIHRLMVSGVANGLCSVASAVRPDEWQTSWGRGRRGLGGAGAME
jgi:hypothetical protein